MLRRPVALLGSTAVGWFILVLLLVVARVKASFTSWTSTSLEHGKIRIRLRRAEGLSIHCQTTTSNRDRGSSCSDTSGTNGNTTRSFNSFNRRRWIQRQVLIAAFSSSQVLLLTANTNTNTCPAAVATASAGASSSSSPWKSVRAEMSLVTTTLQTLLTNWQRAVIDCTYADVPRELLEQKNKELLLEKASTFALFDKSVSVTSCKTVNNRVRDYLGRTGIGPVAGLEALLKKTVALVLATTDLDIDAIDAIVQIVEEIQRELTRADSLSYSARRDFTSMNNFNPDEIDKVLDDPTSNLALCKAAIQMAVDKLNVLLNMLPLE